MQKIPVVFSTNDNFADLCSTAIWSIIKNGNENNFYDIYVFYTRLSKNNIEKIEKNDRKNVNIQCVDVTKYINFEDFYEVDNYTYEIYYRYYASIILDYEKIIYLDSDTIVVNDIADLYNQDIEDSPIAVVRDFNHYIDHSNFDFNSGVMLINSKKFEELKVREKCIELIKNNTFKLPDQTALNIICKDNAFILKPKYNYQVSLAYYHRFKKEIRKKRFKKLFEDEPLVIHFSYITKPYNNIYSRYNKEFWECAKLTQYYDELVDKYLKDPYKVLRESPVEDIYIDLTEEGKVGLQKIFEVFFYQTKYWFLYKIKNKKEKK